MEQQTLSPSAQRAAVGLLSFSKAVQVIAISVSVTFGGIAGSALAEDQALATLPIMLSLLSAGICTVPASLLMGRIGRRAGFILGAAAGVAGAVLACYAVSVGGFAELCVGFVLLGVYQAFSQYYRFAVTDRIPPDKASGAVAFVMAGGVVGALGSSAVTDWSQGIAPGLALQGPFAVLALLLAANALAFIPLGGRHQQVTPGPADAARRTTAILTDPAFAKATFFTASSFLIMSCVMTAAPLAIVGCGLSTAAAAQAIQWHLVAMFAPSFVLQHKLFRHSPGVTIAVGCAASALSIAALASGQQSIHFIAGMVLLGIGWNFLYVGSTVLLVNGIAVADQVKAQGLNELIVWAAAAIASGLAGWIFMTDGWRALLATSAALVASVIVGFAGLSLSAVRQGRRQST